MKRLISVFIAIIIAVTSQAQMSAFQRIAIPALNLKIGPMAKSSQVKWFCYDEFRGSPSSRFSEFKQVHLDGETALSFGGATAISFQEALSKGFIEISSSKDKTFQIVNNTDKELIFVSKKPSLVGDIPGDIEGVSDNILSLVNENIDQYKLWQNRMKAEVFYYDGYLKTLNPTDDQLKNAEAIYKKDNKIATDLQLNDLLRKRTYVIQHEQKLIQVKAKVYQEEEIITSATPTKEELIKADNIYKAKYGVFEKSQFEDKLYRRYYELVEEEDIYPLKVKVYQYKQLLKNSNPTKLELRQADQKYLESKKSVYSIRNSITQDFNNIDYKAIVLKREKLIEDTKSINEIRTGEIKYKQKYGLKDEDLDNELLNRYYEYREEKGNVETFLLYSFNERNNSINLKAFEKELQVPQTGSIDESEIIPTLSFYYKNVYPFIRDKVTTAEEFIAQVKNLKTSLGLPNTFLLDNETKEFLRKFESILKNKNVDYKNIASRKYYDGNIYITTYNYYEDTYKIFKYDLNNQGLQSVKEYQSSYNFGDVDIDKVAGDMYLVNSELTPIGDLYKAIEKKTLSSSPVYHFGESMNITDIQSIIATKNIRTIAAGKNLSFNNIKITSNKFDFSSIPNIRVVTSEFDQSLKDMTLVINKKNQVPSGSGILGKVKFEIYELRTNLVTSLRSRITNLYTRMRSSPTLDFATELRKDLEALHIDVSMINATIGEIQIISIKIFKVSPNDSEYCYND